MLLKPGETCWRIGKAGRAAVLIDAADYFTAARSAMLKARRSIHFLNWAFDPDTLFDPQPGAVGPDDDKIGPFLVDLARRRPYLDVRILCWRSSLPIAATQRFFPHRAKRCFEDTQVRFLLDAAVPLGACQHQKVVVIDDAVAFCGGGDIGPDRWDTILHLDDDPRREVGPYSRRDFPSRHEMMAVVDGEPAAALGALFRDRWRRATGEVPPEATGPSDLDPWPDQIAPQFADVVAGVARTAPAWRGAPEIRENEALHLAAIAAARDCIYLENQYFASPLIGEALARRLEQPDGPEVVLVSTERSPSWFDQMTMDRTRTLFLRRLRAADRHGRLRAYVPHTDKGRLIIVHAKLSIIDDRLVRVGSANLNNRSGGFDAECDLAIEAGPDDTAARTEITAVRARLIAHWLGIEPQAVTQAIATAGGVGAAIEQLRAAGYRRLTPLEPLRLGPLAAIIARLHLGDPSATSDSWRPWRRGAAFRRRLAQLPDAAS